MFVDDGETCDSGRLVFVDVGWCSPAVAPHVAPHLNRSFRSQSIHCWLSTIWRLVIEFALPVVAGSMSIFTDWDGEPSVLGRLLLFGIPILSTIVLVIGLVVQSRNPRPGLYLIIPGAIGPAFWYWLLPLYAPLMIAVIALAVAVTPRNRIQIAAT